MDRDARIRQLIDKARAAAHAAGYQPSRDAEAFMVGYLAAECFTREQELTLAKQMEMPL